MVDVSAKDITARTATASGRVVVSAEVVQLLRGGGVPKGDALAVARFAGIQGAKRTPDLVPLAHPIALHGVTVELVVDDDAVRISATARTADRTGVEMEALTAVAVAGLALIDMVKARRPGRRHHRHQGRGEDRRQARAAGCGRLTRMTAPLRRARSSITVSDRASAGDYADQGGPLLVSLPDRGGMSRSTARRSWPDGEPVEVALRSAVGAGYDVIVTTGGTGVERRAIRPREMTARVLDRQVPGIAEAIQGGGQRRRPDVGAWHVGLPASPGAR